MSVNTNGSSVSPDLYRYSITNSQQSRSIHISGSLSQNERFISFSNRSNIDHQVTTSIRSRNDEEFMGRHLEMVCLFQGAEIERLQEHIKNCEQKKEHDESKYEKQKCSYEAEINELKNIIQSMQTVINEPTLRKGESIANYQVDSLSKKNRQLQTKYQKSLHQISILYDQNTQLQEKLYNLETRLHETSIIREQMETSKFSQLQKYKSNLEKTSKIQMQEKKQEIRRLKDSLNVITKEKDSYLSQNNRLAWQVQELKQLQKQNIEYQNKIVLLSHELQRVNRVRNQKTSQVETLTQQNTKLTKQLQQLQYLLNTTNTQKQNNYKNLLQNKNKELEDLYSRYEKMSSEYNRKQISNKEFIERIKSDYENRAHEELTKHKKQLYEIQNQMIKMKFENQRFKEENSMMENSMKELKERYEEIDRQFIEKSNFFRNKNIEYEDLIIEYEQRIRNCEHKLKLKDAELANNKQIRVKEMSRIKEQNNQKEESLNVQIKNLNLEKMKMMQQLRDREQRIEHLQGQMKKLSKKYQQESSQLQKFYKNQFEALKTTHKNEITLLEQENTNIKQELHSIYHSSLSDKEQQYNQLKQSEQIFTTREQQLIKRIKKLQEAITGLQVQLQTAFNDQKQNKERMFSLEQMIPIYEQELLEFRNKLLVKEEQLHNKAIDYESAMQKANKSMKQLRNRVEEEQKKFLKIEKEYQQIYSKLQECQQVLANEFEKNQYLSAQVKEMEDAREKYRKQCYKQINKYVQEMDGMRNEVQKTIQQQEKSIETLSQKLIAKEKAINELEIKNKGQLQQIQKISSALHQTNSQQKQLSKQKQEELQNFRQRVSLLERQIQGKERTIIDLQNNIDEFSQETSKLKNQLFDAESEASRIKLEITSLEKTTFTNIKHKEEQLQSLRRLIAEHQQENKNLSILINKTEHERQHFQTLFEEVNSDNNHLKKTIEEVIKARDIEHTEKDIKEGEIERLTREIGIINNQYKHQRQINDQRICRQQDIISQLKSELSLLTQQNQSLLKNGQYSNQKLSLQISELTRKLHQKESQFSKLEKQLQIIRKEAKQQSEEAISKYEQHLQKIKQEQQKERLVHEEDLSIRNKQFIQQLNKIKESNQNNLRNLQNVFNQEINYKQQTIMNLQGRVEKIEKKMGSNQQRSLQKQHQLQGTIQQLSHELQRLREAQNLWQASKEQQINDIDALQRQVRTLSQQLRQKQENIRYLQGQLNRSNVKISQHQQALHQKEKQLLREINTNQKQYEQLFIQINRAIQFSEDQFNRLYEYLNKNVIKKQNEQSESLEKIQRYEQEASRWRNNSDLQNLRKNQQQSIKLTTIQEILVEMKNQLIGQNSEIIEMTRQILLKEDYIISGTDKIERNSAETRNENKIFLEQERRNSLELGNKCRQFQQKIKELQVTLNELTGQHRNKQRRHNQELAEMKNKYSSELEILEIKLERIQIQKQTLRKQFMDRQQQYQEKVNQIEQIWTNKYSDTVNRYEGSLKLKDTEIRNLNETLRVYKDQANVSRRSFGCLALSGSGYPTVEQYENKITLLSQQIERLHSLLQQNKDIQEGEPVEPEIQKLSKKCAYFQMKNQQLELKLSKITQKLSETSKQLISYTSTYTKLYDNFLSMQSKIRSFQQILRSFRSSFEENQAKASSNQHLLDKYYELQKQNYNLKLEQEQLRFYQSKTTILKEQITKLEDLNIDLKSEILHCRLYCVQGDSMSKRVEEMMAIMVLQSVEIEALRGQLNSAVNMDDRSSRVRSIMEESRTRRQQERPLIGKNQGDKFIGKKLVNQERDTWGSKRVGYELFKDEKKNVHQQGLVFHLG